MKRLLCFSLFLCLLFAAPALGEDHGLTEPERLQAIEDIIQVAQEEIGYTETKGGYSKYGDWAGGAYREWCSEFVSWCVDQVDLRRGSFLLESLYPMQVTCQQGVDFYAQRGRYVTVSGTLKGWGDQWYLDDGSWVSDRPYIPQRGDCLYIEWYKYNRIDHVALVVFIQLDETGTYQIYTIEGNNPDSVAEFVYRQDDESLRGYGTTTRLVGTTMRQGNKGLVVEELQQALVDQGFLAEDLVTGKYAERTATAVKQAQAAYGLEQTGIADRDTQKALGLW